MKYQSHNIPQNFAEIAKKERINDDWDRGRSTYHSVNGISPWRRVKRIIEANIGKSFDTAFSKYCAEVPVYQQSIFLDEFRKRHWWGTTYFVDKNGNIQKSKDRYKKDKKAIYYSDDYKTERRHKVTGKPYEAAMWWKKKFKEEDYEYVVVSGYALEFSSRKDPEYIRLTSDQMKRKKKVQREIEKEKDAKYYCFLTKTELQQKEEEKLNRLKIEKKGFDYATSFRDFGMNPEVIKEHQGFYE
jgi:hypothetical protein